MATAMIRGKKRSFEAAFKLEVVQYAEKSSNREAGRKFNVDEKCVRQWKLQKAKLLDLRKAKRNQKRDCLEEVESLEWVILKNI